MESKFVANCIETCVSKSSRQTNRKLDYPSFRRYSPSPRIFKDDWSEMISNSVTFRKVYLFKRTWVRNDFMDMCAFRSKAAYVRTYIYETNIGY